MRRRGSEADGTHKIPSSDEKTGIRVSGVHKLPSSDEKTGIRSRRCAQNSPPPMRRRGSEAEVCTKLPSSDEEGCRARVAGWWSVIAHPACAVVFLMRFHNRTPLTARRRQLRMQLTPAEALLWRHLQRAQLAGRKFRRQHSCGAYVLDFYCPLERLGIELDGAAHDHDQAQRHDEARDRFLANSGIKVLRFQNRDVIANLEGVLAEIRRHFRVG